MSGSWSSGIYLSLTLTLNLPVVVQDILNILIEAAGALLLVVLFGRLVSRGMDWAIEEQNKSHASHRGPPAADDAPARADGRDLRAGAVACDQCPRHSHQPTHRRDSAWEAWRWRWPSSLRCPTSSPAHM